MDGPKMDIATRLEVIGRHGVGLDTVDVEAATERGLPVVYTPFGPTESTAEHALMLILATARRLSQLDRAVRTGEFGVRLRSEVMGHELVGKTLGIVGFGRIGQRLAEMCRGALQMQILVYDPLLDEETVTNAGGLYVNSLVELSERADVLSIHTPLTPDTHKLVDGKVIGAMKTGAILVNTSRGPVVDQVALLEALQSGRLGGAGLDVYDPQPPKPDDPLLHLDQLYSPPTWAASPTKDGCEWG